MNIYASKITLPSKLIYRIEMYVTPFLIKEKSQLHTKYLVIYLKRNYITNENEFFSHLAISIKTNVIALKAEGIQSSSRRTICMVSDSIEHYSSPTCFRSTYSHIEQDKQCGEYTHLAHHRSSSYAKR